MPKKVTAPVDVENVNAANLGAVATSETVETSSDVVILSSDRFTFPATGVYSYEGHTLNVTERISKYGTGKLTVYTVTDENGITYERKPIGYYKNLYNVAINHRDGTSVTETSKILSDTEISDKVDNYASKVRNCFERFAQLANVEIPENVSIKVSFAVTDENDSTTVTDYAINDVVATFRADLIAKNEERKKASDERKKASDERKTAAKVRESISTMTDLQKLMLEAVMNNDFARIAELTAQMNASQQ